jgi:hypothetical protein
MRKSACSFVLLYSRVTRDFWIIIFINLIEYQTKCKNIFLSARRPAEASLKLASSDSLKLSPDFWQKANREVDISPVVIYKFLHNLKAENKRSSCFILDFSGIKHRLGGIGGERC